MLEACETERLTLIVEHFIGKLFASSEGFKEIFVSENLVGVVVVQIPLS